MKRLNPYPTALAIFAGLVLSAYLLANSIQRFKKEDRNISVKGFSEKEVKSDLVIWSIKVRTADNDLVAGNTALENARNKVMDFLLKKGISRSEINSVDISVVDKQMNEYGSGNVIEKFRYIIEETIEVRSSDVDLVQKISRMTSELLNAGVALSTKNDWRGSGLRFMFTKLNSIKPQMLAEAIQNAQGAAEQFTNESHTQLGKLRKASQGLFSIQDRDESVSGSAEGDYSPNGTSDLYKRIRVVISVEYSIE